MELLVFKTYVDSYSITGVRHTMTVAELKSILEKYNDDLPIYLSFDYGNAYGGLLSEDIKTYDLQDS